MYDKNSTIPDDLDCIFEDTIDIALAVDDSIDDIKDEDISDEDDIVDTNINYDNDEVDNSIEGLDADDIIAAERDIAFDPFEDDEIIDIAIGDDKDIETQDISINDLINDDDI